ncbi:MAG: YwqG family protein [Firmicutes bacterium]|nr:YwqG family protein [Bacillota bacterium]
MKLKNDLAKFAQNSISLSIGGKAEYVLGGTRFGGVPDLPENFRWDCYTASTFEDDELKPRPLAFIAQFNLEEMSRYDNEHLLPEKGLLSFFYEIGSQQWGYDPKDKGCAKVYWFEDITELKAVEFPKDLPEDYRFPMLKIKARSKVNYPSYEDYSLTRINMTEHWDEYDEAISSLGVQEEDINHKLLGWSNPIQGNMTQECELVSRNYYLGNGWDKITPRDRQESIDRSKDWQLLFQLDTVSEGDFELMFGDCGRIYYYIRKKDLAARNFDNIWLILQCC